jgi:uncharacterized membrane protein
MRSMYKPNISTTARLASTLAGAALAAVGYRRKNRALAFAGLGMVARGASGFCPVSAAVGRDTASYDTRQALGGSRGTMVEDAVTIYRPVQEVYAYWRHFENLPLFMSHLEEVREIAFNQSHWIARGPLGIRLQWDAEIIHDIPGELISWKSVGEPDVVSAGSVHFRRAGGDHGTEVHVKLQYDPPAGKMGATAARVLGEDAQHAIAGDLRRFKELLEAGEISTGQRYRASESSKRARRDVEAVLTMTDPLQEG